MPSGSPFHQRFTLGPATVDSARSVVTVAGQEVHLEPKAVDLLLCLAEAPGVVLSKAQLLARVWPDSFVSEVGLARLISELRKALGDDARQPTFIETVPKRGYRLMTAPGPAVENAEGSGSAEVAPRGRRRWASALFVAQLVLTFGIYGAVPATRGGAPSPSDSRQAAYGYTLKARDLYGTYRLPDNEAAISLLRQAIDLDPHFALAHAELASALVLQEIRYQVAGSWLPEALEAAQKAIREAPELAEGHKALGMVRSTAGHHREAAAAFTRALELRPDYPEALYSLAGELQCLGRLDLSLPFLERWSAQARLNPQDYVAIGVDYMVLGELAEARAWLAATVLAEPHQVDGQVALAQLDLKEGALDSARRRLRQLLAVQPDCAVCLATAGDVEREAGDRMAAEDFYRRACACSGEQDLYATLRYAEALVLRGANGAAAARLEALERRLRKALHEGEDAPHYHVFLATIAGLRGHPEDALEELDLAAAAGWLGTREDLDEAAFKGLVNDPRFQGLVARLEAEITRQRVLVPRLPLPRGP